MLGSLTIEELNRLLTASKWALGVLAVLIALAGIFNQWISDRISDLQRQEKAVAQARLKQSEEELQQTKQKTLRLESRLAPRTLSTEQMHAISEVLKQFAGTQLEFASYQDDAEVKNLVLQLIKTLLAAGWKGLNAREFLMASLVEGVVIEYAPASSEVLSGPANAFAEALNQNGVQARVVATEELNDFADRLRIKVGKKPVGVPE